MTECELESTVWIRLDLISWVSLQPKFFGSQEVIGVFLSARKILNKTDAYSLWKLSVSAAFTTNEVEKCVVYLNFV